MKNLMRQHCCKGPLTGVQNNECSFYMKLDGLRQPETGITLRSFSQIIHDLLRGKWQLFQRPC